MANKNVKLPPQFFHYREPAGSRAPRKMHRGGGGIPGGYGSSLHKVLSGHRDHCPLGGGGRNHYLWVAHGEAKIEMEHIVAGNAQYIP